MRAADALTTLEELGSSQWGLVTAGQAEVYGVSRVDLSRLADHDRIRRIRRGVYEMPSAGVSPHQDLRAAWLATAPRELAEQRMREPSPIAVSHTSAISIHELGDLTPIAHELTSPRRHTSVHKDIRFHRAHLPDEDRTLIDGLPVTSVPRTVCDVAAAGTDLDHLAGIVRDALSRPDVTPHDLGQRLDPLARRYGHSSGDALVDDCLDRAGYPAVAKNLAPNLTQGILLPQLNESLQAISRSLVASIPTPESMLPQLNESLLAISRDLNRNFANAAFNGRASWMPYAEPRRALFPGTDMPPRPSGLAQKRIQDDPAEDVESEA